MKYKVIADSLGIILMFFSVTFLVPLLTAVWFGEGLIFALLVYGIPALISLGAGFSMRYYARGYSENLRDREAFASVSFAWLLMAFLGALPYAASGVLPSLIDAYFESMSGFATVGSTVIVGLDHAVPKSILMWRSLTQWLGGMGFIVLSVVILARVMGRGAATLFKAEVAGHAITRLKPKIQETAKMLWALYAGFTFAEFFALWILGMTPFDAINHAMTTLATGGFGTKDASIGFYDNALMDAVIMFFIIIGSTNFVLHYEVITTRNIKLFFKDPEWRLFMSILSIFAVIITGELIYHGIYSNPLHAFRMASFQVVSMGGTCGYVTADFAAWPPASQFLLLILMFFGGSAGSTAGAIKIIRILVILKLLRLEVHKVLHPRGVIPVKIGDRFLPEDSTRNVAVFFAAYVFTFIIATILVTLTGLDIVSSASAVITAMGGVGPGLNQVAPHFLAVAPAGKLVLSMCMWLGRLELFAALLILFPSTYKK